MFCCTLRCGLDEVYDISDLYFSQLVLYLPVAIYVPALTFNQVSGIDIHLITPIVCLVCTFYTCAGGLKAVVWTDVIQSFVMYGTVILICIKGTYDVGGLSVVLERNAASGRLNAPDVTWDPTVRLSILSVLVGGTLHKIQSSDVNQVSIQRFLSLPTLKKVKQTMIVYTILLIFLLFCCCYMGLITYATFHDCDPLTTKLATARDQLPTLLVMRTLGAIPGLPGLFVAGVFSAALSSLSTGLNSLACVISQDIVKPLIKPLTDVQMAVLLRLIVVFFGVVCMALVFVVEKLGMVLQLSTMISAVSMGPLLGIYTMGVCLPWINGKSALTGGLVSFFTTSWLITNAQISQMKGELRHPTLPVSVEGCSYAYDNFTIAFQTEQYDGSSERNIYHLSFLWFTSLGGVICITVAALSSLYYGRNNIKKIDPALLSPLIKRYLPKHQSDISNVEIENILKN
ncbi:sodium-coupled monocarboxylate transporter 2-like [Teleopsis dalmanni]|uniref:sodium-coupled monocarboxylate transporter 2-like n=1 Tax=Teleopsis dalmanni TaxID=139649 RepID=UPI0018CE1BE1|nr:sodium-coupled monocarboxylate transporter 2-like [Teleopsis dalmanni]